MLRSLQRSIEIVTSRVISLIFIVSSLEISTWHLFIYLLFVSIWNLRLIPSTFRDAAARNRVLETHPGKIKWSMLRSLRSIEISSDSRVISFIFIVSSLENCIRNIHVAFIYLFSYYSFQFKIWDLHVLIIGQVRRRRRRRITEIRILEFLLLEEGRDLARLLDQTGWQNRSLSLWRKRERLKFPAAHSSEQ